MLMYDAELMTFIGKERKSFSFEKLMKEFQQNDLRR